MIARRTPLKRSTKPIARSKTPIQRRTRPAKVRKTQRAAERRKADREWSAAVKAKGPCVALGQWMLLETSWDEAQTLYEHTRCSGPKDPGHVVSRRFALTRTDLANGVPICRAAHDWFTARPLAWKLFCRQLLGNAEWERLYDKAHGISESKGEQS